ncbi:Fe-S protein assembly chaperone HscA [bacterium]|nr:Fe-S protein assembly chaperone HscA [bacterium]NUP93896.1 Fe-S protein assembly chaperone HscA [Candidatus Omnitrophota bacterium]
MRNLPIYGRKETATRQGPIIGIDLGTTNSLVAFFRDNQPFIIPDRQGHQLTPSVVSIDEDGHILVGHEARNRLETHPEDTVFSIKRFMGRGVRDLAQMASLVPFNFNTDENDIVRINLKGKFYSAPELSARILAHLKKQAEDYLGEPVSSAVITVPAYFNDSQRQATKDAGMLAGLDVRRVLNEPTAASLAYGLQEKREGLVAVYDLGGGTFDFSLLRLYEGIFQVLATHGDTHLGGDDFDQAVIHQVLAEMNLPGESRRDPGLLQGLRLACESMKTQLTDSEQAVMAFRHPAGCYERVWTRAEFEALIQPFVNRTLDSCRSALQDAGVEAGAVDEVVLVGGSTRVPLVRQEVERLFGRSPHCENNPDEVVALGAAVQANILSGSSRDMLLLDVTPLSLGIETYGGVIARIIPRNTTIPTSATEMFTTYVDGQTGVDIHVLQGERELASDCRSLARFQLKGIPPLPAGMPKIAVTFMLDADGILRVEARDERSGKEQFIEVRPSYGLTDSEIEQMLKDSFEHGGEDLELRLLVEVRVEAERVIRAADRALVDSAVLLEDGEEDTIRSAIDSLKEALQGADRNQILERQKWLDQVCLPFAERQMNAAVRSLIRGKGVDQAEATADKLRKL